MRAERRHELKENDLIHALQSARTYMVTHRTPLTWGVILVLVVVIGTTYVVRARAQAVDRLWEERAKFYAASLGEDRAAGLQALQTWMELVRASSNDGFALQSLADQVSLGLQLAATGSPPPDRAFNDHARGAAQMLLDRFPQHTFAQALALSTLATVEENEFALDGDLAHKERARAHLTAMLERPALNGTPFQTQAADRLKALDSIFTVVAFAPPLPPEEAAALESQQTPEGLPPELLKALQERGKTPRVVDVGSTAPAPTGQAQPAPAAGEKPEPGTPQAVPPPEAPAPTPADAAPDAKEPAPEGGSPTEPAPTEG
ncbi:MAG TPA: hypothetical protein PKK06_15665 [Phycisphaerae bacterium]|nr:hypothetical protein [Phycisphaerae bacterium]HNU46763.1 hypothetical protein [Phycisphaerae bacterium]